MLVNTSQFFVGNASGREPLHENRKPYAVSVSQSKKDARFGGPFPMKKKAKCISIDFVNHQPQLTSFVQSIGGSFWAPFLEKKAKYFQEAKLYIILLEKRI